MRCKLPERREANATLRQNGTYIGLMLLPALSLLFGTVFWLLTLLPEPQGVRGVTWPGLFFADQRFPVWQIIQGGCEIGAMVLLTSGLLLLFRHWRWSLSRISMTGIGLSLVSLASLWLWPSAVGSTLFVVFLVGLGLASSPWTSGGEDRPRQRPASACRSRL